METVISTNRHKVSNALAQDDITYENYLRLAEWIFVGKVHLKDLQDDREAKKRMKEIDELRARGDRTPYEDETIQNKKRCAPKTNKKRIVIEVTNLAINEKTIYKSLREFCDLTGTPRTIIKERFKRSQSKKILFNRMIIRKVEIDTSEFKIRPHRIYLNSDIDLQRHKTKWCDYEKAFIVQNKSQMKWKDIGIFLGRSAESCSNVLRNIKKMEIWNFIGI